MDEKTPDIIVRPQEDGTTLYDVPVENPKVGIEMKLEVNRGKGIESHIEKG